MTSKSVRDRDSLTLEVVPDSGNNPPLGRMGRGMKGRGLIDVVRRHRHTRRNRQGRLCFINDPDVQWGHDNSDTICVLIAFIFMTLYRPFTLREKKESLWEGEGEKAAVEEVARAEEEEASKIRRRKRKLR